MLGLAWDWDGQSKRQGRVEDLGQGEGGLETAVPWQPWVNVARVLVALLGRRQPSLGHTGLQVPGLGGGTQDHLLRPEATPTAPDPKA